MAKALSTTETQAEKKTSFDKVSNQKRSSVSHSNDKENESFKFASETSLLRMWQFFSWNLHTMTQDEPPEEPLQHHHGVESVEDSGANGGMAIDIRSGLNWVWCEGEANAVLGTVLYMKSHGIPQCLQWFVLLSSHFFLSWRRDHSQSQNLRNAAKWNFTG